MTIYLSAEVITLHSIDESFVEKGKKVIFEFCAAVQQALRTETNEKMLNNFLTWFRAGKKMTAITDRLLKNFVLR